MKSAVACTAIAAAGFLIFAAFDSRTAAAGEKNAVPAKPSKPDADAAAANRLKGDERAVEAMKSAAAEFEKAATENDAATAEIERFSKAAGDGKSAAKITLEQLKRSLEKKDPGEFKKLFAQAPEALKKEFKAWQEERKRENESEKGKERTPSPSAPGAQPPSANLNNVKAPAPVPLLQAPDFPEGAFLMVKRMYSGPTHDPRNPDIVLPGSDVRTRMVLMRGDVRLRKPLIVLDADEADIILAEGEGDIFGTGRKEKQKAAPVDPVHPGSVQDEAFERIVARGRVRVMFVDASGTVRTARGGVMIYDAKSGILLVKEWPEVEYRGIVVRGTVKTAVIEASNLKAVEPDFFSENIEAVKSPRRLTLEDMPRTTDKLVPGSVPLPPKSSAASAPR